MSHMTNPSPGLNARNAIKALEASQTEWMSLPQGQRPTAEVQAHALRTQALIQAATVHALLDIAESLRKISEWSTGE